MAPKMNDVDFSFQKAGDHRRQVAEFKEDIRRHRIQISDPNAPAKKPWKVNESAPGPSWEFTRDKTGKITAAKQLRPRPNSMDTEPKTAGIRYICKIEGDPISIGGQPIESGCEVNCFADCAFSLHNVRGKIIEEYRES